MYRKCLIYCASILLNPWIDSWSKGILLHSWFRPRALKSNQNWNMLMIGCHHTIAHSVTRNRLFPPPGHWKPRHPRLPPPSVGRDLFKPVLVPSATLFHLLVPQTCSTGDLREWPCPIFGVCEFRTGSFSDQVPRRSGWTTHRKEKRTDVEPRHPHILTDIFPRHWFWMTGFRVAREYCHGTSLVRSQGVEWELFHNAVPHCVPRARNWNNTELNGGLRQVSIDQVIPTFVRCNKIMMIEGLNDRVTQVKGGKLLLGSESPFFLSFVLYGIVLQYQPFSVAFLIIDFPHLNGQEGKVRKGHKIDISMFIFRF